MTWQKHWYVITNLGTLGFVLISYGLSLFYFYHYKFKNAANNEEVASRNPSILTNQLVREYWYWLSSPVLNFLIKHKFTPNSVSWMSLFVGLTAASFYAFGHISTAGWFLVFSGALDTLDGGIARATGTDSQSGAFLDSVIDRYIDFIVYAGIVLRFTIMHQYLNIPNPSPGDINTYLVLLTLFCMLGSSLVSYTKERGFNLGAKFEPRGLMQRADRIVVLGVASIFDPLLISLIRGLTNSALPNYHYVLGLGLLLIAFFANRTAIKRVIQIRKALE